MNEQEFKSMADAWAVETSDIRARVAAAIGAEPDNTGLLLGEIRAMRHEMDELRRSLAVLQHEIVRLRHEPLVRPVRLTPYAPTESLMRQ